MTKSIPQKTTAAPDVPIWVSAILIAAIVACSGAVILIGNNFLTRQEPTDLSGSLYPQYLVAAVPFFFLLMAVEAGLMQAIRFSSTAAQYRLSDSLSNMSAGITQQLVKKLVVSKVSIGMAPYLWIWNNFALHRTSLDSWTVWCGAILLVDLGYYWLHRLGHAWRFLWAGHSVHHNNEVYNLTTALRQSYQQSLWGFVFYLPLALFLPPIFFFTFNELNTWYQFWVHTCLVRRMGFLEYILVTPSHHRVHHDRRVHRNFAGMFIIWDRMFGTFLDETDAPPQTKHQALTQKPLTPEEADLVERNRMLGCTPDGEERCLFGVYDRVEYWTEAVTQTEVWRRFTRRGFSFSRLLKGPGFYTVTGKRYLATPGPSAVRMRHRSRFLHGVGRWYTLMHWCSILGLAVPCLVIPFPFPLLAGIVTVCLGSLYCIMGMFDATPAALRRETLRCVILGGISGGIALCSVLGPGCSPLLELLGESRTYLAAVDPKIWIGGTLWFGGSLGLLWLRPEAFKTEGTSAGHLEDAADSAQKKQKLE